VPIAALLHLTAISVENTVAEIDTVLRRLLDQQNLVATDTKVAISQIAELFRRQGNMLANTVKDNKIVAQAMHFREFEFHVPLH
jgi:hypothetical protein